ncbi:hypothetical protein WJX79_008129 [Trebouxia sp. C0005]
MAIAARLSRRHLVACACSLQSTPAVTCHAWLHTGIGHLAADRVDSNDIPDAPADQKPPSGVLSQPPGHFKSASAAPLARAQASAQRQVDSPRPAPSGSERRQQQPGESQNSRRSDTSPREELQPPFRTSMQMQRTPVANRQQQPGRSVQSQRPPESTNRPPQNHDRQSGPGRYPNNQQRNWNNPQGGFQQNRSAADPANRSSGNMQGDFQRNMGSSESARRDFDQSQQRFRHQQNRSPSAQDDYRSVIKDDSNMSRAGQRPSRQPWQSGLPQLGMGPPGSSNDFDPDDPHQNDREPRRRLKSNSGRRVSPSPTRTERGPPGANIRGGGPAKGPQMRLASALGVPDELDPDDLDHDQSEEEEERAAVPENMLTRLQHNIQGVPASWKDEIQDVEDQENLDEAREISAFMRRKRSGDIKFLDEELQNDMHALQMNSDPRLEFGMGTPVIQETAPPEPSAMLQAAREPLRKMMGIESDEDWQELTDGLAEEFAVMSKELEQETIKPRAQEASLQRYVNESMPSTHPMFPVVSQSLQMLQHNPNWNHQKKAQYMWRLIHDLR